MGDGDYMYAFQQIVMPIAREFDPDFVIGMRWVTILMKTMFSHSHSILSRRRIRRSRWGRTRRMLCDPCVLRSYDPYADELGRWQACGVSRGKLYIFQGDESKLRNGMLPGRL